MMLPFMTTLVLNSDENFYEVPVVVSMNIGNSLQEYAVNSYTQASRDFMLYDLVAKFYGNEYYCSVPSSIKVDPSTLAVKIPIAYYVSCDSEGTGDYKSYLNAIRVLIGIKINGSPLDPKKIFNIGHYTILKSSSKASISVGGGYIYRIFV